MIDLCAEFMEASAAAEARDFDTLVSLGVPSEFLRHGAKRFGVAEIVTANGFYEPMPEGRLAFIVPAIPLHAPWHDCHARRRTTTSPPATSSSLKSRGRPATRFWCSTPTAQPSRALPSFHRPMPRRSGCREPPDHRSWFGK